MLSVRKLFELIIYSNIFIGICAVAITLTDQISIDKDIHLDYNIWFIFFSTMLTYTFLKLSGSNKNQTLTTHKRWAADNSRLSKNLLLISLVGTVFFFFQLERNVKITVALLGGFTAFYGFIDIPFFRPKKKLRDFGMLKTVFVAIVWSVTTVVIPFLNSSVESQMMGFLLLRRFLFILALTIPFEIKDMADDRAHSLNTLSLRIGVSNTKLLAQIILLLLMLILVIQYFFFGISLYNMLAVNISFLVSILCVNHIKEETDDLWYYFVLDGMMILQFVLVYAVQFFSAN